MTNSGAPHPSVTIGGWPVSRMGLQEAADAVAVLAQGRRPELVVTPNLSNMRLLHEDRRGSGEIRRAYEKATLVLADGMPLVWLSRITGHPLPERVTGADLELEIRRRLAPLGGQVIYVGGVTPAVTSAAVANRRADFPGLDVHGLPCSMRLGEDPVEDRALVAEINRRLLSDQPAVILVCTHTKRSTLWAARNMRSDSNPTGIQRGVIVPAGAVIDFASGRVSRAPRWMREHGLEAVYRCFREPRRLAPRYAKDAAHLPWLIADALRERRAMRYFGEYPNRPMIE